MNILIAGANGYIGSKLYVKLKPEYSVTTIDHNQASNTKQSIKLNLTDVNQVKLFADNCVHFNILIFLVGLAHAKGKGKDLPEFRKINYQTLVNLLSAFERNNKIPEKIIFASTISVYGEKYNQNIYNEDIVPKPFTPYASTKVEAEQYLFQNFSSRSWILRFAPVYSPDFFLNVDRRTKIGGIYYKTGNGLCKLSLCNIENITTSVEEIIKGKIPPGFYNISDPAEYTYVDLLTCMNAVKVVRVPMLAVIILYRLGTFFNITFIKENTVKLITNNIFPSNKIRSYIELKSTIYDVKNLHTRV